VLCARLAGDPGRPRAIRLIAAALAPLLAAGLYLSYSRGALAVAVLGLLVLAALAPSRAQLRAAAVVLVTGICVGVVAELLPRSREGITLLAALIVAGAVTAFLVARTAAEPSHAPAWYSRLRPLAWAATALVAAGLLVGGIAERPSKRELSSGAGAGRLTSVSSNRYEYWRVALNAFRDDPLIGAGSGGFRVVWLQERPIRETVRDTHSLEFEVAAELGLVGLLALALMCGGMIVTARRALAGHGPVAAGAAAALVVWFLHASIDWDWEMPAVTLPALVLAGLLITQAEGGRAPAADDLR
jgi:O-antigen ligase